MRESELIRARALASAELRQQVSPDERRWLHDHPLLWLRAINQINQVVQGHIASDRKRVAAMKPGYGCQPSPEYLNSRVGLEERTARRLHFLAKVQSRRDELIVLCGPKPARQLLGDVVDVLTRISMLIDMGETQSARDLALSYAERISE